MLEWDLQRRATERKKGQELPSGLAGLLRCNGGEQIKTKKCHTWMQGVCLLIIIVR